MAIITVRAPQPVTEVVCGVPFVEGVARVDPSIDAQRRALLYFTQAGYSIDDPAEPNEDQAAVVPVEPVAVPMPSRAGSKADWVAYATQEAPIDGEKLTAERAEAMTRDQLVEKYLGPKED